MPVVLVRHMRVRVSHGLVLVQVAVHSSGQRIMPMGVVPVVVAVGMFMFRLVVLMRVPMSLREMEHDA